MGKQKETYKFIDLFAGIGGIRQGFEEWGCECVFTSEWNKFAQQTYAANFPNSAHHIDGDITKIIASEIPNHDILLGGFPCQPFSIAGISKKNSMGRVHGFEDKTQGTLFFDVARIIKEKKPKAFMLENVKNLMSHDGGKTFAVIQDVLENELGYKVSYRVLSGEHFVPQKRERIIIVGFRDGQEFDFNNVVLPEKNHKLAEVLHTQDGTEKEEEPYTYGELSLVNPKYTLSRKLWEYLQSHAAKHKAAGNGFGCSVFDAGDVARTLSARYYKDGSEILIKQAHTDLPRRLTPRECARIMGFKDTFKIPVSDAQAYRQFGNSVVVPVIKAVAKEMVEILNNSRK